jgi:hypothetical protein
MARTVGRAGMTTAIVLAAALTTSSAALAATPKKPLTKQQYIARADALCAAAAKSLVPLRKNYPQLGSAQTTPKALAAFVKQLAPVVQRQIDKTAALSPPKHDRSKVKKILRAEQSALDKLKADPSRFFAQPPSPFATADALAHAYGLTDAAGSSACIGNGAAAGATANVPSSCGAIASLVGSYIGGVATSQAFPAAPNHLSCEFANANASAIVVVNIGQGSASSFATLRAASSGGGRTITPVSGLGAQAFSISKNGKPGGIDAVTATHVVYSVATNLPFPQTEALIRQLMALP